MGWHHGWGSNLAKKIDQAVASMAGAFVPAAELASKPPAPEKSQPEAQHVPKKEEAPKKEESKKPQQEKPAEAGKPKDAPPAQVTQQEKPKDAKPYTVHQG